MHHRILMVCTGNICRSPLAAAMLGMYRSDLEVRSAGLAALVGHPVDATTAEIALSRSGLVMPHHAARQFTAAMGRETDLILVMEDRQRKRISAIAPELSGRSFLVTHWTTGQDIMDPFQRSVAIHAGTHDALSAAVAAWASRIPRQGGARGASGSPASGSTGMDRAG